MLLKKFPLGETKAFTPFFLDYLEKKDNLKPFYNRYPQVENFAHQITEKSTAFPSRNREIIQKVFQKQYSQLSVSDAVKKNISRLTDKKTYTITTGHQLNIFTGPLYFIYKIVTVINTCRVLKQKYPDHNFIPVYWMASEDHDFEEIKYFRLYGKKYTWETDQKGAVGKFSTKDLEGLLDQLPGDIGIFRDAYLKHDNLSEAVRYYVNELFGSEGLLVLDPDDHDLKEILKPVIQDDVIKGTTLGLVEKTNKELEKLGYKTQVFCRDINFFYLDDQVRSRIEKENGNYTVGDTELSFSEKEITGLISEQPEKFSPNVILRPLYQEMILPNLAYVGGPAEVTYWLQLKPVFDHYKIPFPILMPRNLAMVMEHQVHHKFEKTGLALNQIFEDKNILFNHWTQHNTKHDLSIGQERGKVNEIFEKLKQRAEEIDTTLGPFVGAEGKRALNSLEKIEGKLLRAEKRLHEDKLRQIESVKETLFPDGELQERTDNFLNLYQKDSDFIRKLYTHFEPFDFRFHVLIYPS